MLANLMFDRHVLEISTKRRITTGHLVGEVVATAGLTALVFALARRRRARYPGRSRQIPCSHMTTAYIAALTIDPRRTSTALRASPYPRGSSDRRSCNSSPSSSSRSKTSVNACGTVIPGRRTHGLAEGSHHTGKDRPS